MLKAKNCVYFGRVAAIAFALGLLFSCGEAGPVASATLGRFGVSAVENVLVRNDPECEAYHLFNDMPFGSFPEGISIEEARGDSGGTVFLDGSREPAWVSSLQISQDDLAYAVLGDGAAWPDMFDHDEDEECSHLHRTWVEVLATKERGGGGTSGGSIRSLSRRFALDLKRGALLEELEREDAAKACHCWDLLALEEWVSVEPRRAVLVGDAPLSMEVLRDALEDLEGLSDRLLCTEALFQANLWRFNFGISLKLPAERLGQIAREVWAVTPPWTRPHVSRRLARVLPEWPYQGYGDPRDAERKEEFGRLYLEADSELSTFLQDLKSYCDGYAEFCYE